VASAIISVVIPSFSVKKVQFIEI